jgi:16S rRNA G1207 methylase RsmC
LPKRATDDDYSGVEAALIAFIGEHFDGRVLEVGCGTGLLASVLGRP